MIKMNRRLEEMMQELKKTSAETFFHSVRTKKLVLEMIDTTNRLGITNYSSNEIDAICKGALLHDIGKLRVDNFVLTKDTYLTAEEKAMVQEHVNYGYNLVKNELEQSELQIVTDICLYHHERIDGSGYAGKKDLPLYVQLVSICDVFDSLYSDRVYRDGFTAEKSMELIANGACGMFDEKVVALMQSIAEKVD